MGKNDDICQLTNLMSRALRHKIGSIVNKDEIYAAKYAKDSEVIMAEAKKISVLQNWSQYDKQKIKEKLRKKLEKELSEKTFIDHKKYDIMDDEIEAALVGLGLN